MENKENNRRGPRKGNSMKLSVTVIETTFLKDLVEMLAYRRNESNYSFDAVPDGWRLIETSSIEAHIGGTMDLSGDGYHLRMAYTTCFSFTCIRMQGRANALSWVNSLS